MPRIPTYDNLTVSTQPIPGVAQTARGAAELAASGGGELQRTGEGLARSGAWMTEVAARIQEQDNVEKVQAAQAAYGEQVLEWMREAKSSRVGHKAEGVTKDFDEWNAKASSDITASLGNEAQRRAFTVSARRHALASKSELAGFELGEKKKAGLAAYNAANTNAVNTAATAASPELLALQRQTVLNSVATQAALQGWGEEETQAERGKWLTALHLQRISNMVSRDPEGARKYFETNKAEIDGTSHDAADKLLKTGELKDGSLKLQFELQSLPGLGAQTKELDKRFKDGSITAEMRDATLQRLEHDYNRRKALQAEGEKSLLGQAQDFLLKNPNKSVQDLDPKLYSALKNTGHLATIVSFAKNGRFDNDPAVWAEIISMPASQLAAMTPTEFHNTYRAKLDDAHLERGYSLIEAARGNREEKHLNVLTATEITKRAGVQAGILPASGTPSKDQTAAFGQFETEIDRQVRLFEKDQLGGKRRASTDELKQIVDGVLKDQVYVRRTLLPDTQRPVALLTPTEQENAYIVYNGERIRVSTVPPMERAKIIAERKKLRLSTTEADIVRMWVEGGRLGR